MGLCGERSAIERKKGDEHYRHVKNNLINLLSFGLTLIPFIQKCK